MNIAQSPINRVFQSFIIVFGCDHWTSMLAGFYQDLGEKELKWADNFDLLVSILNFSLTFTYKVEKHILPLKNALEKNGTVASILI